jgi:hypothetical protein
MPDKGIPENKRRNSLPDKLARNREKVCKDWETMDYRAFLKKYACSPQTAKKYLGAREGHGGARQGSGWRPWHQRGDFLTRRDREIAKAQEPWRKVAQEAEEARQATKDLYRGEMYPEGAPLRAVGL